MISRLKRWWRRDAAPALFELGGGLLGIALIVLTAVLPVITETAWFLLGAAYRGCIALACYNLLRARFEGLPPLDFVAIWSILVLLGLVARTLRPPVVTGTRPVTREVPPERGRY